MLITKQNKIVNHQGQPVRLRGINLGGWLMMEGYILGGRNIPESVFKAELAKRYGKSFAGEFSKNFRESFIQKSDFETIRSLGFNCIRLPFNCRILEEKNGLNFLRQVVQSCAEHKIYIILDMHAVPGAQNADWHSDSTGEASFWEQEKHRKKFLRLWEKLAQTFKNEEWIAGYDIMNEPVTSKVDLLGEIYQQTISTIRSTGDQHIIFLEGNRWGMEIDFLKNIRGNNLALSIHYYQPVDFTFNWLPDAVYPGNILGKEWNKAEIKKILAQYFDLARSLSLPLYCGEFGVASRCPECGQELAWLRDVLELFDEFDIHWTYWTYKGVKGMQLPDGLFQLTDGSGIIGNPTTGSGMDNFYNILKTRRNEFFQIWRTENFKINQSLYATLKPHLR